MPTFISTRKTTGQPLGERDAADRDAFFARYEQIILAESGVAVSLRLAKEIWDMAIAVPKELVEFEETRPVLAELRRRGYRLAVLTNHAAGYGRADPSTGHIRVSGVLHHRTGSGRKAGPRPFLRPG